MTEKMRAEIIIEEDEETLRAIAGSLEPDNLQAPSDIKISMRIEGKRLVIELKLHGGGVLRLRNTIDDILQAMEVATKAVEAARGDARRATKLF